jgi:hypothetical protein
MSNYDQTSDALEGFSKTDVVVKKRRPAKQTLGAGWRSGWVMVLQREEIEKWIAYR